MKAGSPAHAGIDPDGDYVAHELRQETHWINL